MGCRRSETLPRGYLETRIMSFRQKIRFLWKQPCPDQPYYSTVKFVNSKSLIPDDTGRTVYIVGTKKIPKWVIFECPCGQKHQLNVPLMKSVSPHWTLIVKRGAATLSPSISVDNDPCTSHFWLRNNRIEWARWTWEREDMGARLVRPSVQGCQAVRPSLGRFNI